LRALIAENLANNEPWYMNIGVLWRELATEANRKNQDNALYFEKGVRQMLTEEQVFETHEEKQFFDLMTQAWRIRQGQIWDENSTNPVAFQNRRDSEQESWLRELNRANQEQTLLTALNMIYARVKNLGGFGISGYSFPRKNWRRAQHLAISAIVFYTKRPEDNGPKDDSNSDDSK